MTKEVITAAPKSFLKQIQFLCQGKKSSLWAGHLLVLATLIICEIIWYGPVIRKVGFYLDDWATYSNLYLAQQNWQDLLKVSLADSRIITRPIEALVYVGSWLAFHDNPFGHHLLNCFFEVIAAFFLYLSLSRLSGSRPLSFIASLLMLIYPNHDATHYWVTANTINLALAMYLGSLWQAIKAVQDQKPIYFLYSTMAFLLSLLTYEAFLPFILVTGICLIGLYKSKYNLVISCLKAAVAVLPSFIAFAAVYYYQRIFLVQLGKGFHHTMAVSIPHAMEVIQSGFSQTILFEAISAYALRIQEIFFDLDIYKCVTLVLLAGIFTATLLVINDKKADFSHPYVFIALGLVTMLCSYSVFAASPEYTPNLETIWNRINIGASVGASMILAGFLGLLVDIPKGNHKSTCILLAGLTVPIIVFFVLADWGWSIPWIKSWTFQKYVVGLVKNNKDQFKGCDSVILANCPRYVMWSPLFDGVWDFQAMLRMYSNNSKIQATVTSDRLVTGKNSIKDISCNFLCGEYPYKKLVVFIPNPTQWIAVNSGSAFIDTIDRRAKRFGMTQAIISHWQSELIEAKNKRLSINEKQQ